VSNGGDGGPSSNKRLLRVDVERLKVRRRVVNV
jgi:hypothetical protein